MRIVSWNINSVRRRVALLRRLVRRERPDVVCLQETKCANEAFPVRDVQAMGLRHLHLNGQPGYHGVAILSRHPLEPLPALNFGLPAHARYAGARVAVPLDAQREEGVAAPPLAVAVHNFYVPAGGDTPDPQLNEKFGQKLSFLDAMAAWSNEQLSDAASSGTPTLLVGDLNIAPLANDVWSHKRLQNVVSHTRVEVEALEAVQAAGGWRDVVREAVPAPQPLFTWWSYRAKDWRAANRGRRLDHIWGNDAAGARVRSVRVLEDVRGWDQPSDHAPVV
ncbi:MAG: exodeoxyribonuclease III, partial [Pseudomonadota bacterium]